MWNPKVNTVFFIYKEAANLDDQEARAQLYYASYKGYQSAMKSSNYGFQDFSHKKYALVCEKLLHLRTDLSEIDLCEKSIKYFQAYVELHPTDTYVEHIKQALHVLTEKRSRTFQKIQEANRHMTKHGLDPL